MPRLKRTTNTADIQPAGAIDGSEQGCYNYCWLWTPWQRQRVGQPDTTHNCAWLRIKPHYLSVVLRVTAPHHTPYPRLRETDRQTDRQKLKYTHILIKRSGTTYFGFTASYLTIIKDCTIVDNIYIYCLLVVAVMLHGWCGFLLAVKSVTAEAVLLVNLQRLSYLFMSVSPYFRPLSLSVSVSVSVCLSLSL